MNRREFSRLTLTLTPRILVGMVVFALAGNARGVVTEDVKKSDVMAAYAATIAADVKQSVAALVSGTGSAAARDELVRNASMRTDGPGVSTATPAYLDAYAEALNKELLPLAQNSNLSVRLNAAIVAARVAQVANNARLSESIVGFVNDKSDPVVLWGIRGSLRVLPSLLKLPAGAKHALLQAIVDAMKKHPEGVATGWIANDAYTALTLDFNVNRKALTPAMIAGTIDAMQNLLAVRLDRYKIEVPPNTAADRIGTNYLTDGTVWATQNAQQQTRTVQLASDLLSLAAQQLEAQAKTNNTADVGELADTINRTAKAMSVAASAANQPGIVSALQPATLIQRLTPPAQIIESVRGVYAAIKASPKFNGITEPPRIQGTKAAPTPTTAPTDVAPGTVNPPPPPPPLPPVVTPPAGGGAGRPGGGTGPGAGPGTVPPRTAPPAR